MAQEMDIRLGALEDWRNRAEPMIAHHGNLIEKLNDDIRDIRISLAGVATKEQVADLKDHVDRSINGLLREALNATPQWYALLLTGVIVLAGIVSAVAAYMAFHH
jgi:hypothetical protein